MAKEQMMTAGEVAAYLRCSISTVRRFVRRGEIPHYRLGTLVRFRKGEIDRWLTLYHEGEVASEIKVEPPDPGQLSLFPAAFNES